MCRNHRGFVEAVVAANRIGSDVVLLNTSFAGPALAEVVNREGVDAVIYDEEFTATVDRALADKPDATRIVAWTDGPHELTVEKLIAAHTGQRPERTGRKGRMILLTSGTTGTPKGANQSGGNAGIGTLKAILDRTPWRAEETIVIVAPMFHAWGFSQLIFAASMACTVVTRRKFDPEATLDLIDRHKATGLAVVPVMFDRIMELPDEVRNRYSCKSLRFAAASGFADAARCGHRVHGQFGDVIYNNYNATEAGMIATATPATCAPHPTPRAGPRAEPKSGSWTPNSTSCPPARSAPSTSATTPNSTATPRAPPRISTPGSCRRATSATSTRPDGCSSSAATTR